jgi:hypothetical protein
VGHLPRRAATALLTGPVGRFTAFVIDVGVASARYYVARARGREMSW